jgi:hypothetical protein
MGVMCGGFVIPVSCPLCWGEWKWVACNCDSAIYRGAAASRGRLWSVRSRVAGGGCSVLGKQLVGVVWLRGLVPCGCRGWCALARVVSWLCFRLPFLAAKVAFVAKAGGAGGAGGRVDVAMVACICMASLICCTLPIVWSVVPVLHLAQPGRESVCRSSCSPRGHEFWRISFNFQVEVAWPWWVGRLGPVAERRWRRSSQPRSSNL